MTKIFWYGHFTHNFMSHRLCPGESSPFDWRKCDAVAMVISNCPMKATSVEAYYKQVSSQVMKSHLHYL